MAGQTAELLVRLASHIALEITAEYLNPEITIYTKCFTCPPTYLACQDATGRPG
jgi:hypothetical protein